MTRASAGVAVCRKCKRLRPHRDLERRGRHYYCCADAKDCAAWKARKAR